MPPTYPTATSSSNFQQIFNNALKAYQRRTKKDLLAHPLAAQLQACDSPTGILPVLQKQVQELNRSQSTEDRLTKWLGPTVNVLSALSDALGEGVGLVCSRAQTCGIVSYVHLTGLLSRESDLFRSRCPPFRLCPSQCLRAGHFDANILQAAKDVRASQDALVDVFERIDTFFRRLEIYTSVPLNEEMMDTITTIMVEFLCILAIATEDVKQGRISKFLLY
jgi:hypothetical protein